MSEFFKKEVCRKALLMACANGDAATAEKMMSELGAAALAQENVMGKAPLAEMFGRPGFAQELASGAWDGPVKAFCAEGDGLDIFMGHLSKRLMEAAQKGQAGFAEAGLLGRSALALMPGPGQKASYAQTRMMDSMGHASKALPELKMLWGGAAKEMLDAGKLHRGLWSVENWLEAVDHGQDVWDELARAMPESNLQAAFRRNGKWAWALAKQKGKDEAFAALAAASLDKGGEGWEELARSGWCAQAYSKLGEQAKGEGQEPGPDEKLSHLLGKALGAPMGVFRGKAEVAKDAQASLAVEELMSGAMELLMESFAPEALLEIKSAHEAEWAAACAKTGAVHSGRIEFDAGMDEEKSIKLLREALLAPGLDKASAFMQAGQAAGKKFKKEWDALEKDPDGKRPFSRHLSSRAKRVLESWGYDGLPMGLCLSYAEGFAKEAGLGLALEYTGFPRSALQGHRGRQGSLTAAEAEQMLRFVPLNAGSERGEGLYWAQGELFENVCQALRREALENEEGGGEDNRLEALGALAEAWCSAPEEIRAKIKFVSMPLPENEAQAKKCKRLWAAFAGALPQAAAELLAKTACELGTGQDPDGARLAMEHLPAAVKRRMPEMLLQAGLAMGEELAGLGRALPGACRALARIAAEDPAEQESICARLMAAAAESCAKQAGQGAYAGLNDRHGRLPRSSDAVRDLAGWLPQCAAQFAWERSAGAGLKPSAEEMFESAFCSWLALSQAAGSLRDGDRAKEELGFWEQLGVPDSWYAGSGRFSKALHGLYWMRSGELLGPGDEGLAALADFARARRVEFDLNPPPGEPSALEKAVCAMGAQPVGEFKGSLSAGDKAVKFLAKLGMDPCRSGAPEGECAVALLRRLRRSDGPSSIYSALRKEASKCGLWKPGRTKTPAALGEMSALSPKAQAELAQDCLDTLSAEGFELLAMASGDAQRQKDLAKALAMYPEYGQAGEGGLTVAGRMAREASIGALQAAAAQLREAGFGLTEEDRRALAPRVALELLNAGGGYWHTHSEGKTKSWLGLGADLLWEFDKMQWGSKAVGQILSSGWALPERGCAMDFWAAKAASSAQSGRGHCSDAAQTWLAGFESLDAQGRYRAALGFRKALEEKGGKPAEEALANALEGQVGSRLETALLSALVAPAGQGAAKKARL